MANFNRIVLLGNLTRDPQLKYLPSQMAVAEFGLAVNHKYKTKTGEMKEEVMFVDCSVFGAGAEVINKWCRKGKQLMIEGRLKFDSWEDKQGGGKRSKHSVVVDNFQLLGGRDDAPGGGGGGGGGGFDSDEYEPRQPARAPQGGAPRQPMPPRGPAPSARPQQQPQPEPPFSEEQQFKDDDIPF